MVILGGCASSAVFTDSDRGQTKTIDAGSIFSIALPPGEAWKRPTLDSRSVEFLGRRVEEPGGRHLFEFRADRIGEAEIRIPSETDRGSRSEYILRVRVTSPMMPFVAR